MDCLFNLQVPRSKENTLIIGPAGKTFVTGLAKSYAGKYDRDILGGRITEDDFKYMIDHLNSIISHFWPCNFAMYFGYLLCPLTCGLSFMVPNCCLSDAKL
jgi:hypothetical protein